MANVDWAPSVGDVGAQLRARTKDTNGNELGTFTANTRPTDTEVAVLVGRAVNDVVAQVGRVVPDEASARDVAALGTALLIELSYYPEQVATGQSPYEQLAALYEARLGRLAASDVDPEDNAASMLPTGGFGASGPVQWPPIVVPRPVPRVDWRTPW